MISQSVSRNSITAYDVVVVGGGHAGVEAAHAAARMGCRTALITFRRDRIGYLSCNPAMGGVAKGQLIKEIDALGGVMGRITDRAAIQYKRLNSNKGPAVRSPRAQCDKPLYAAEMQAFLSQVPGLDLIEGEVSKLLTKGGRVSGVVLSSGVILDTRTVIVTSGTFLAAVMHCGSERTQGGRVGDSASFGLSTALSELGFRLRRLKTGTPPRLHRDTIDFSKAIVQPGDDVPVPFSYYHAPQPFPFLRQVNCFITHTNEVVHDIINKNIDLSPMYTGAITGAGPRYCPSIEDKVKRFSDKSSHQVFLEPEGLDVPEIYVNGVSTSLPASVQELFIRRIPGLESAEFIRHGYAVEYDAVDARQLKRTLESKDTPGLFTAGQINGTSGYEEAGAQGLIAGINAALRAKDSQDEFILKRSDAYIGVMLDDLVTSGSDEPYRLFTSRAEHRLLLREDNADLRLSNFGLDLGLLSDREAKMLESRRRAQEKLERVGDEIFFNPTESTNEWLAVQGSVGLKDRASLKQLLRRPEITIRSFVERGDIAEADFTPADLELFETEVKYEGYITREHELIRTVAEAEAMRIPVELDFLQVHGLSNEVRNRLELTRPETVGQMSRIQGMTPAAVANLVIHLKNRGRGVGKHCSLR